MSLVYPILPRAGLGNMLLIWARAAVFSHLNNFPMIAPNWAKLRLGPYLRGERDKRNYQSFFRTGSYIPKWYCLPEFLYLKSNSVFNPIPELLETDQAQKNILYVFEGVPVWETCFMEIFRYQPVVKQQLVDMLSLSIQREFQAQQAPVIGVHIRMGDFKVQEPSTELTKESVHSRTPLKWFIEQIKFIREIANYNLPVTVFSDGHDAELTEILSLPNISRASKNSSIVDILTLSKSKLLKTSSRSTFSAWAAYLSSNSTIWHPAHLMEHFGRFSEYKKLEKATYEGCIDRNNLPKEAINVIQHIARDYLSR